MKYYIHIAILFLLLFTVACKESADIYLGIPLQPEITDNNFKPGLNIIGIIRPDYTDSINNSFIHVQEVAPAINNYPEFSIDSLLVETASVMVTDSSDMPVEFKYTSFNNIFSQKQYRPAVMFRPEAGKRYKITCSYNDLPILNSETQLPLKPIIIDNSINLNGNKLSFEMKNDTSTFLYDVYVFKDDVTIGNVRIISNLITNTPVQVSLNTNTYTRIVVYGFDYNLANYYTSSNTSLNFNKYRKPFGNIENGYGVFGSLNLETYTLK